jgi:hypothetical protein
MAELKFKFYRCFNALYSKSKSASSELICVELLKSYCLPIIFYACEAVWPNISSITSLDRIINQAVSKIFNTFDQNDVHFIRAVVNLDDARATVQRRQATFVSKFKEKSLYFAKYVVLSCYMVDILPLFNRLSSSF